MLVKAIETDVKVQIKSPSLLFKTMSKMFFLGKPSRRIEIHFDSNRGSPCHVLLVYISKYLYLLLLKALLIDN